jgi:hypothetical protein
MWEKTYSPAWTNRKWGTGKVLSRAVGLDYRFKTIVLILDRWSFYTHLKAKGL